MGFPIHSKVTVMGKILSYLQQPESIHAISALLLNTRAFGGFTVPDLVEWLDAQGATVNIHELEERLSELAELGFAEPPPPQKWECYRKIGYILTENGEEMAQALMDCVNYIGKLGGEKNTRQKQDIRNNIAEQR